MHSPVDKVSKEEVVGVGDLAANLEELHKVIKLPMNVAAYLHRQG